MFEILGDSRIHGEELSKQQITYQKVRKLLSNTQQDFVRTFGTKSTKCSIENTMNHQKGLYAHHAYSIYDYDPKTDIVKYINPRNSTYIFQMKLQDLIKHISHIEALKID